MSGLTPTGFIAQTTAQVQTSIQSDELALIDPALNLSPTQPLGQLNGIYASAAANFWALIQAVYAALDPNGAVGVQLDNLCAITGVTRLAATKTSVVATLTIANGTYTPGQLVSNINGYPQYTFTNRDTLIVTGGSVFATFLCTQTGPIACNAGTLTVITTPVTGWTAITNLTAGTIGTNVETDTALRLRRASLLASPGGSSVDALRSAVSAVPGVISAQVLENNSNVTDVNFTPPHSFLVYVWDGPSLVAANNAIAQAIWNSKPSGIASSSTGSNAQFGTAIDATGRAQTVYFSRVVQYPIYVIANLVVSAVSFPSNGLILVQNAINALATTPQPDGYQLLPGVGYYTNQAIAAAMTVPGVIDVVNLFTGLSPSPGSVQNFGPVPSAIVTFASVVANVVQTV